MLSSKSRFGEGMKKIRDFQTQREFRLIVIHKDGVEKSFANRKGLLNLKSRL